MTAVERDTLVDDFFRLEDLRSVTVAYLCLREAGRRVDAGWLKPDDLCTALPAWIERLLAVKRASLELTLLEHPEPVDGDTDRVFAFQERGLWGFSCTTSDAVHYLSPNEIINGNWNNAKALNHLLESPQSGGESPFKHRSRQWLLLSRPRPAWKPLCRQLEEPRVRGVDPAGIAALREGLADWLYGCMDEHGRIPYKYWPGSGQYSSADNVIRQWLATQALQCYVASHGDKRSPEPAKRRLRCTLADSYLQQKGCGLILDRRGIKLGAIAVAGLAMLDADDDTLRGRIEALYRSVLALRRYDGSFRTFWSPPERDDNQNFYPGEALLFLARLYRDAPDTELHGLIDESLDRYQAWHQSEPNPAFVPWHTQAYAVMYAATGDAKYLEPIVVMNDWLLGMQQWETAPYPEMRGRFYEPDRPDYGPPHVSSTAVYVEGLVAAAGAMKAAGRHTHVMRYTRAALRGLANLRQLQYLDVVDTFRMRHPKRVQGALRTEVYDATVRIDSVAHALVACLAWEVAGLPEVTLA